MIDLEKTSFLRMYQAEAVGPTLVISLRGDAVGYGTGAVHSEMTTLLGVARQSGVRNLLIDMSLSNYFGSLVLGEIVNLGQVVRERGGRVALCGVSNDMQEILRIMKLDALWERFPTRASALRGLGGVPWSYQLKPLVKPAAIALGLILLIGAYFIIPRRDPTLEAYRQFSTLWQEGLLLRDQQASETDWLKFTKKANRRFNAIMDTLTYAGHPTEASLCLATAVRDFGPPAVSDRLDPRSENTQKVTELLAQTGALLEPPAASEKSAAPASQDQSP